MNGITRRSLIEQASLVGLGLVLVPAWARARSRDHTVESWAAPSQSLGELAESSAAVEAEAPPPWAALAPYEEGASLPLGWTLASLTPVQKGSALLTLRHTSGREAVVRLVRRGSTPIGIAQTRELDMLLVNGAKGQTQTNERLGRVLLTFAAVIRARENVLASADHRLRILNPSYC